MKGQAANKWVMNRHGSRQLKSWSITGANSEATRHWPVLSSVASPQINHERK